MYSATFLLSLLTIVLFQFDAAHAHATMCTPRQRAAYFHDDRCGTSLDDITPIPGAEIDNCPFCLNGGGLWSTIKHQSPAGWIEYDPVARPNFHQTASLCGDGKGNTDHMLGGRYVPTFSPPLVAHWRTGSVINLEVELAANHFGYFEFFLCDLAKCGTPDIAKKCFSVPGACHKLRRVVTPDSDCARNDRAKTEGQCAPQDPLHPDRWYVPCYRPRSMRDTLHLVGGDNGHMQYRLPHGVKCEHCVMQWYWVTGNGCLTEGVEEFVGGLGKGFADKCPLTGMPKCSTRQAPEEYWACADVKISDEGRDDQAGRGGDEKNDSDMTDGNENGGGDEKGTGNENGGKTEPTATPESGDGDKGNENGNGNESQDPVCVKRGEDCDGSVNCCPGKFGYPRICAFRKSHGKFVCSNRFDLFSF